MKTFALIISIASLLSGLHFVLASDEDSSSSTSYNITTRSLTDCDNNTRRLESNETRRLELEEAAADMDISLSELLDLAANGERFLQSNGSDDNVVRLLDESEASRSMAEDVEEGEIDRSLRELLGEVVAEASEYTRNNGSTPVLRRTDSASSYDGSGC